MLKALDLYCGGGGASMGLARAGFCVEGVDYQPQPKYPFQFHLADALTWPLYGYDFIWASPPCQAFSRLRHLHPKDRPNLIPETRSRLIESGIPYCIENVEGAPLGDSGYLIMLCGTMFGLRTKNGRAELRRHRLFETSFSIPLRPACQHGYAPAMSVCGKGGHFTRPKVLTVVGHTPVDNENRPRAISITGNTPQTNTVRNVVRETFTVDQAREAMGIDWMSMKTLSQAIPPAYSEFIGREAIRAMNHDSRSTVMSV
jgi:DNA (cytosine-5)-methyltransferase 1